MSARFDPTDLSETCALLAWMENRHFTFLGYREYRLRGRKGREVLRADRGDAGSAFCGRGHKQPESTDSHAAGRHPPRKPLAQPESRHQVQLAVHRAPPRISRLCGHQAIRRQGRADRRTAFLGFMDLRGLQQQPARHPDAAPESRAGGAAFLRWPPTATTARRCSTSSRPFPAMNCSRPALPNSTASPPASSACRTGRGCACCCAATHFAGFIPAWCSCRARNTTRRSASASNG